jgi:vacuolar iron transporter family protein
VILGGQDGLVNILGIILGVIAGGGTQAVLLAAGFAAAITESISMGAVGWTPALARARLLPGSPRHGDHGPPRRAGLPE